MFKKPEQITPLPSGMADAFSRTLERQGFKAPEPVQVQPTVVAVQPQVVSEAAPAMNRIADKKEAPEKAKMVKMKDKVEAVESESCGCGDDAEYDSKGMCESCGKPHAEGYSESFSPKEVKMAIGVASDKRYAGGNMSGASKAIDKIKKGLSSHPQVAAVLKRQNEELDTVNTKALKKDFSDRKDKDIDNDGDSDSSDEYLHKRRKAISKALASEAKMTPDQMKKALADDKAKAKPKGQVTLKKAPWDMKKEEVQSEAKKAKPGHNATVMSKNISKVLSAVKKEELDEAVELDEAMSNNIMGHEGGYRQHKRAAKDARADGKKQAASSHERAAMSHEHAAKNLKDGKHEVALHHSKDAARHAMLAVKHGGEKTGSHEVHKDHSKAYTDFTGRKNESVELDEISMGKMAAYADKAVKSRNDAKAATHSADSNRRDKAQKTIVKRKAGADNYNKKMWGYSNVAPTKEHFEIIQDGGKVELIDIQEAPAYTLMHNTFSGAVQEAIAVAKKQGFEIDEDDWSNKVATGPKKPSKDKTNSYTIDLMKGGKPAKKKLHMQVYNMGPKYELNCYVQ